MNTAIPFIPNIYQSHRDLISIIPDDTEGHANIDAIIIPVNRPAHHLDNAIDIAEKLGCVLVVLCSRAANIDDITELAQSRKIELLAIDCEDLPAGILPEFKTSKILDEYGYAHPSDTSIKRNIALVIARLACWQRIVFLDDDIQISDVSNLTRAAGMLDKYAIVGLDIGGYLDNSVVNYVYRAIGGMQGTFIGTGALVVNVLQATSFFPRVYNEDWFFLFNEGGFQSTAFMGHATQKPYDPFATPQRAVDEEVGDLLGEGIMSLLHDYSWTDRLSEPYWSAFIDVRRSYIQDLLAKVERIRDSLNGALSRLAGIDPSLCVSYFAALAEDQLTWAKFLDDMESAYPVPLAAADLSELFGINVKTNIPKEK